MKIAAAEFVISAAQPAQFPRDDLPQIAFCGRSNVGKSSLINSLVGRRNLAHTSSTPGKTRQLNFYRLLPAGTKAKPFYFVDLPGYGYAKVSHAERESWRRLIEGYFKQTRTLCAAVALLDCRHGALASDQELLQWLAALQVPVIVAATKADKLSNNQRTVQQRELAAALAPMAVQQVLLYSAVTHFGRKELWQALAQTLPGRTPG
ncbi:MAG: ribosome biogenesis GTP-binding protein YihA/YsxC [candidate division KSB1 bacterium]|nr:ribosome biogenesis GTP-binding protein YihA/YsxC [candidate division KSB1 bacterium]MDZ7273622.1 ribosome biogenesis GTP-binding protein YihA/YsxC [candidate division KSB1 bacterium]MDZ7286787.1 ribosome biogenesis GTP-binding protein YihA/YsxC [candidate division KSB1 bacterium]MDZ7299856.1 ribosome biogenesis GTP-binding protein YihA/YsxC [candidate division KSB1 bacterium]MDZ7305793.1 ribosome biogenesis GTP-binding protein YihA/YsxC [candidate division KSB1 bacterium]